VREMHSRGIGVGRYFRSDSSSADLQGFGNAGDSSRDRANRLARDRLAVSFNRIQNDQIEEVCSTLTELSDFASNMEKKNVNRHNLRTQSAGG